MKRYTFTIIFFLLIFTGVKAQIQNQENPVTAPARAQHELSVPRQESSTATDCQYLEYQAKGMNVFPFNTKCKTESYPFITPDGRHLYYTNNQVRDWIFYTGIDEITGQWTVPVPIIVDGLQNTRINSCYMTPDLNTMFITGAGGLYKCTRKEETNMVRFVNLVHLNINGDNRYKPFSCISFTPDMEEMIAYTSSKDATMCSYRWVDDHTLEYVKTISMSDHEMGVLSNDGLRYYFTNDDHKNVLYLRRRAAVSDTFSKDVYICKEFEKDMIINQVRMTAKEDQFVLVQSRDVWNKNDIFFWHSDSTIKPVLTNNFKVTVTPAVTLKVPAIASANPVTLADIQPASKIESRTPVKLTEIQSSKGNSVFKAEIGQPLPNPSNNFIYCYYKVDTDPENPAMPIMTISDQTGRPVITYPLKSTVGEAKIDVSTLPDGIYLLGIQYLSINSPTVKVVVAR